MRIGVHINSYREYRILEAIIFKNIKYKESTRNDIKTYLEENPGCNAYIIYYKDSGEYEINAYTEPYGFNNKYISFKEYLNLYFKDSKNIYTPLNNLI